MKKLLITIAASLLLIGCGGVGETLETTTTTSTVVPSTTRYVSAEEQYIDALRSNGIVISSGNTDVSLGESICEIFDAAGVNDVTIAAVFEVFGDYGFEDEAADYIVAATMFLCPEYDNDVSAWADATVTI